MKNLNGKLKWSIKVTLFGKKIKQHFWDLMDILKMLKLK